MYSGNTSNSNNMLYGGPLGTYLSGIYQPLTSINHNVSKVNRRNSLRGGNCSSGGSSLYYTPQPRRRHENTERYIPQSTASNSTYGDSVSTRSRPKSYYNSSASNTASGVYIRPTSMVLKNNTTPKPVIINDQENINLDYKKLYEDEKSNNDQMRKEINEIEKEIKVNKDIIESKKKSDNQQKNILEMHIGNEIDLKEFELLKNEGDKLRAENRALARVVARLSREK